MPRLERPIAHHRVGGKSVLVSITGRHYFIRRLSRYLSPRVLLDKFITWRDSRAPAVTQAPLILLTGAGASIPAGVISLQLPIELKLDTGVSIRRDEIIPPGVRGNAQTLDLESLMIISQLLKRLPRNLIYRGFEGFSPDISFESLTATACAMMPLADPRALVGEAYLSEAYVGEVIKRIVTLDKERNGAIIGSLYNAIHDRIIASCLSVDHRKVANLYGELFGSIVKALSHCTEDAHVVPIYTTNYDETFDIIADELACEMALAISKELLVLRPLRELAPRRGIAEFVPAQYKQLVSSSNALSVVPIWLHGSVRWAYIEQKSGRRALAHIDQKIARSSAHYRVLLPPDGTKVLYARSHERFSDALGGDVVDPFRPGELYYAMRLGYKLLERNLKRVQVIVAIGYSFRDTDCLEIFHKIFAQKHPPRLILLDPDPRPIIRRLSFGGIVCVQRRFGELGAADDLDWAIRRCWAKRSRWYFSKTVWDFASETASSTVRICGLCRQRFLSLNSQVALQIQQGFEPCVDIGGFCGKCGGYVCERHAFLDIRQAEGSQYEVLACQTCREILRPDESSRWTDCVTVNGANVGTLAPLG